MELFYHSKSLKALTKMPINDRKKVRAKIEQYSNDPDSLKNQVKKLQGLESYRLRVGDYRVIFDQKGNIINILNIDSRGDIYKRGKS